MPSVLVTGARQGLGLEFCRQFAAAKWQVHATCLDPATAEDLRALDTEHDKVALHELDVDDHDQVAHLADHLSGEAIDLVLNNAGRAGNFMDEFGALDYDNWQEVIRTNLFGPTRVAEAFFDHVARSERKMIATVASGLASIAVNWEGRQPLEYDNYDAEPLPPGGFLYYRTSKAALNMMIRNLAIFAKPRGVAVVGIAPGHAATEMGGWGAPMSAADSVAGMRGVLDRLSIKDTGKVFLYDGREYPW